MEERYFKNPYMDYSEEDEFVKGDDIAEELIKNYVEKILRNTRPDGSSHRGDVYVGDAGIAFMFWKIHCSKLKNQYPALENAVKYIESAKRNVSNKPDKQCGLLCGNAGIHAVSAVISNALSRSEDLKNDLKHFMSGSQTCLQDPGFGTDGGDEFLVGRAGYLAGSFFINQSLNRPAVNCDIIKNISSKIIQSGRDYSRQHRLHIPLMYQYHGSEYLGAAHGLASILWVLLEIPQNKEDLLSIKQSIDIFMDIQENGDFPTKWSNQQKKLVHWCHGSPGAIYLFAQAFLLFKDEKYLAACRACCDSIWEKGLLLKGPGICHGIAGNGYAFLMVYRLTKEQKYLYRAHKFMEFLKSSDFKRHSKTPDRPFSLYEGLAGTVCFSLDFLEPENAYFPFMDVFGEKFI